MRVVFIVMLLFINTTTFAEILPSTQFKSVQIFINEMVEKHGFNKSELEFIFSKIKLKKVSKIDLEKTTNKSIKNKQMTWEKYQSLFITEKRIDKGIAFWQKNKQTLLNVEKKYGVPIEIIVAILGIESNYGETQGKHPTLKTLISKAFGVSNRRNFYRKELESFLLLARDYTLPPLAINGSYAGALGHAQFIPSSYRHYAIDFDNDSKVDLFNSKEDAIGSIANYLVEHKWQRGGEIARPVYLNSANANIFQEKITKPTKNAQQWRALGLDIDQDVKDDSKIAFIVLNGDKSKGKWITFWNFYTITRYNHDNRYAMAVYQLSEELKKALNSAI